VTTIQQVLFQLEGDYLGHPYYVSGHAIATAIADRLDAGAHHLHASMGVFVPGAHGDYPDAHSQSGGPPYFGTNLRPVETYDDLFLFRDAAQRWLRDRDPRDAHNTHDLREYGDRTAYASSRSFGRPPEARNTKRTVNWYVHCYLYSPGDTDVVPVADATLDGLRLGGARNYGFGLTSLQDTQTVDHSSVASENRSESLGQSPKQSRS
jgi:hypothetical protein